VRRTLLTRIKSETRSGAAKRVSASNCNEKTPGVQLRFALLHLLDCDRIGSPVAIKRKSGGIGEDFPQVWLSTTQDCWNPYLTCGF